MKKIILLLTLFVSSVIFSQMYNPVTWKTSVEKITETEYVLVSTAKIERGWAIYGQGERLDKGPIPTTFRYIKNDSYELVGENESFNGKVKYDKTFEMKIKKFYDKAVFKQKIKLLKESAAVKLELQFMVCNNQRCLPPSDLEFTFYAPIGSKAIQTKIAEAATSSEDKKDIVSDEDAMEILYGINADDLKPFEKEKSGSDKSMLTIFLLAFLGGCFALLTPCVFPMIPMTVSYFTKQSKSKAAGIKNAVFYGLCIIVIYVFLGVVVTKAFGAESLNHLASNVWFNLGFFLLLVVFAFSFFGYFEITLPSSWSTKVDSQADRGGYIGIFFMALALAIVSFSCTGPIVGGLLVESVSKGSLAPAIGMLGFSLAIALPFALFAAFPGWLNSLPQSGGWMTSVKVVLGFLELALAFKFLSAADLAGNWYLFKYEVFMVVWIILFLILALYLFGKVKFPHDSPIKKLSAPRIVLGLLSLGFAIYLCFGFRYSETTKTYKPLSALSGLAPPASHSIFYGLKKVDKSGNKGGVVMDDVCSNNLPCFKDFKRGLAYARENKKPIMVDFTGHSCVNCRKMEDHVWSIKKIDSVIRNEYVLISLYVDDNEKELPKEEQIVVKNPDGSTKKLKTYGAKWSHLQAKFFKTNSQPYYVLMGYEKEDMFKDKLDLIELNSHFGYTPDDKKYFDWLVKGTKKFQEINSSKVDTKAVSE